jgi:hypothetical protein
MAQPDVTKQQHIGYWLGHADKVITEHVDRVLSDNGFTRFRWQVISFRWQVINIVYQASTITRSDLFDTMQTFIRRTPTGRTHRWVREGRMAD